MFQLIYLTFTQPRADAATVATMTAQMKAMLANQQASPEWVFQQTLVAALTQNHFRARLMTPAMVDEMNLRAVVRVLQGPVRGRQRLHVRLRRELRHRGDQAARRAVSRVAAVAQAARDLEERRHHAAARRRREGGPQGDRAEEPGRHRLHRRRSRSTRRTRWRSTRWASSSRAGCAGACGRRCGAPTAWRSKPTPTKIPEPRYSVTIQFGCDPDRTEELVATLLREVERLKAEGPTESEVADAREALMVAYQTDLAENSRLADRLVRAVPVAPGRDGVLHPACRVPEARHAWGSRTPRAGTSTPATTCASRCSRRPRRA